MTAENRRRCLQALIASLLSISLLTACVSADSLQLSNGGGKSFTVRGKNYDQIWKAATLAMSTDMSIVESHRPSGVIKSRVGAPPSGKVVGFFIQPTSPTASDYTVTIVSKKPLQTDLVDRDWEPSVVEDFKAALGLR